MQVPSNSPTPPKPPVVVQVVSSPSRSAIMTAPSSPATTPQTVAPGGTVGGGSITFPEISLGGTLDSLNKGIIRLLGGGK